MKADKRLFRAWDVKKRIMLTVTLLERRESLFWIRGWWNESETRQGNYFLQVRPDDCILIQSTGLLDKSGAEIFEGDVVRQELCVSIGGGDEGEGVEIDMTFVGEVVVLPSKGVCLKNPTATDNYEKTTNRQVGYRNVRGYRCEIIGNIHANPELLDPPK